MKYALVFAAVGEAATGLALLVVPSLVGRLLLGVDLAGIAIPVARVAGIALVALGIACWPGPARIGMVIYGAAVALYLAYLGVAGGGGGVLLWPAVVLHVVLTALLIVSGPAMERGVRSGPPLDSRETLGQVTEEWSHQLPRKSRHDAGLHASFDQPRHLAGRLLGRYGEWQLADVDTLDDVRLDVARQDIRDGNALAPELDARRVDVHRQTGLARAVGGLTCDRLQRSQRGNADDVALGRASGSTRWLN